MSMTNFAALTNEELTVWSRDFWQHARNLSFMNQFASKGTNSLVQRVTDLKKDQKGARAVMTLIHDLEGDGVAGDNTLEGNEEAMYSSEEVIRIDQLRHANRIKGRMAEQKSVVTFRNQSRDKLAYWCADRLDQMAFLTLSGVGYGMTNKGAGRTGSGFTDLEFAADVTAPSARRHLRWDASTGLEAGDTSIMDPADKITYVSLLELKAYAKDEYIRGIKGPGGEEIYHVFVTPQGMKDLKLDQDYLANVRNALPRSGKNPLFAGTSSVMVDGLIIHEFRHVFSTKNALSGTAKWGAGNDVDGQRALFCGAQALGFADIGNANWVEDDFDYKNSVGISVGKIFGFLKPKFESIYFDGPQGTKLDFGVIAMDYAL